MNTVQIAQIKLAKEYLDSFIYCEVKNKKNCTECGNELLATQVVPFGEAIKALELLSSALDIEA